MTGRYTRLKDGTWAVKVSGKLEKGAIETITVQKKDGSETVENIRCIWTGKDKYSKGKTISLGVIVGVSRKRYYGGSGYTKRLKFDEDEGSSFPCHICGGFCFCSENGYCPKEGR